MIRKNFVASRLFAIIALVVVISNGCVAYRILCLFPTPATSHQIVFRAYTKALADNGHELVVATTHPLKDPPANITQIDWSSVSDFWKDKIDFSKSSKTGLLGIMRSYISSISNILDLELSHPEIKNILQHPEKQTFDLVIVENHFISMFEFARHLKVPLLVICSSDPNALEHESVGNYVHAVAAPLRISATYGPMNFLERLKAKSFEFVFFSMGYFMDAIYADVLTKHFGPNVRSMYEMAGDIDMLFINVNPAFGYIRPITPKTITLGFMHITDPEPLPKDLQTYLDGSKNGVIYCSFGTNIHSENFDVERLQIFLEAFGRLKKYDVLYKFGSDTVENKPDNVKLAKWVPQTDLLAHKNVKLFITQGGQHSIEEAIYREVPLLAVPFFGDQFSNAKRIEGRELGKWLDVEKITSDELVETIDEIITNPKYKENVVKLGKIVKDEQISPTKKAVWWTEYLIRNDGAKHLAYHGVKVPTYQIYYLDVIAAYLAILTLLYYLIKIIVRLCARLIRTLINKIFLTQEVTTDKKSKTN